MSAKRILISVGDDSADLHAANFMRRLSELAPGVRFVGLGMERMKAAGLEPLDDVGDSAMWLHNALRLGRFARRLRLCRRELEAGEVDLVAPVDFGGFNMYLCREAARRDIPVFYYIPPQVWAHGRYRIKKLRRWTSVVGLIYPFEAPLYERYGVSAQYVGHPLFDELRRDPPSRRVVAKLRERFGDRLLAIFPGSRRQEIRAHLPMVARCVRTVRERIQGVQCALICPPRIREEAAELCRAHGADVTVLDGVRPVELARAAHVCLTKSGTITLEIASQSTPMIIFYRTSPLLYFFGMGLSQTPYAGLVNVLAGDEICPEKVMRRDAPDWLAEQVVEMYLRPARWEKCHRALGKIMESVARPGASERAARIVLKLLQE
ncbi:MAG: lipid-A-disaccharide synthase [Planctomycetes bacterium]|nr:lipid-A-disaccharide synthase [Planctomycetota bacterium]